MRWILHGKLSGAVSEALKRHEQTVIVIPELQIDENVSPAEVLKAATLKQVEVLTADPRLASEPFESDEKFGRTIVQLLVGDGDVEQDDAIDRLFKRYRRLSAGRLYTVTGTRVKIRQLPTNSRTKG